jgi:hypothetical protein
MIPIEFVVLLLLGAFGMIGIARRFPLEIGATIGFVAMLLMFDLADRYLGGVLERVVAAVGLTERPALSQWFLYTAGILGWVVFMYVGQTLRFGGIWPPGRLIGTCMDLGAGLLNGWIVVGTWWYYTDKLGYPIQQLGVFTPPLSDRAAQLVGLTPQALMPEGSSLVVLAGLLVALIGLRVFR